MMPTPFFSIITVARDDAWSLVKTMRSVFEQEFRDFEYIVVDGASTDRSQDLVAFWQAQGLVTRAVSEPDSGVYNAMNKGLGLAAGRYVCFMNASDVFADRGVLGRVHRLLADGAADGEGEGARDGVLGWGELNGQIWASWTEHEAFMMASLGFCHQALFVRRDLLVAEPFDERPFKTDSDTLQTGRLYRRGARIAILPEVLAVRGGEPGISADAERSAASILDTLAAEYPGLTAAEAQAILAFRRSCQDPAAVLALLARPDQRPDQRLLRHLARLVLDTLCQRQSARLDPEEAARLAGAALAVLEEDPQGAEDVERLILAQGERAALLAAGRAARRALDRDIARFDEEETRRIAKWRAAAAAPAVPAPAIGTGAPPPVVVSLTSFPARLKTVAFAIQSLFEQTLPPAEIHLWLGRDEVPGPTWLPARLRALEARGLRVHFAARTCHQYDKILHNAGLNAERPFVIVDDDVIYPPRALEHLVHAHARHPQAVVGNRCHRMLFGPDGRPLPYRDWPREVQSPEPDFALMPTGAGGVLYPPGMLTDPRVTDVAAILAHAPYADDIWLKVSALAQGRPTFATALSDRADWYHRYTPTMMAGTLMATNVERGLNDVQIARSLAWLDGQRPGWRADLAAEEGVA